MPLSNEEIEMVLRDDPFEIMGVSPEVDREELVSAYRRLAKKYHPDLHPTEIEYGIMMGAINSAYERIITGNFASSDEPISDFDWRPMPGYMKPEDITGMHREGIPERETQGDKPANSIFPG